MTYIDFESALHLLAITYLAPGVLLIAASAIGLAVVETVERVGEL